MYWRGVRVAAGELARPCACACACDWWLPLLHAASNVSATTTSSTPAWRLSRAFLSRSSRIAEVPLLLAELW